MQHSQKQNRDKLLDKAYQQYLDSLDNLIDTAIDEFNELIDPRFDHQIQMSPEDAMISILKEKAAWADYIANTYYNTMRQIWAEESDLNMPDRPDMPTVDYRRTVWKIAHGLNDTDYPGIKFTDVINDKAHGYTMADIWQRAINKTLPKTKPGYTQAQHNEDLESFISEFLEQQARLSMRNRIEADPSKPRWARIPRGLKTCAFCYMLSSRGFKYLSEESAGGREHYYHPRCDCQVIPSWGEQKIDGYDPDSMYKDYLAAREKSGSTDVNSILNALRRSIPRKLKDGVYTLSKPWPEDTRRVTDKVWHHIIYGEDNGKGGHSAQATNPYKSHFPETWDEAFIKYAVQETVVNPDFESIFGIDNEFKIVRKLIDGIIIEVRLNRRRKRWKVNTAYPPFNQMNGESWKP